MEERPWRPCVAQRHKGGQELSTRGKISREMADKKAEEEYRQFNPTQRINSDFDKEVKGLLGKEASKE